MRSDGDPTDLRSYLLRYNSRTTPLPQPIHNRTPGARRVQTLPACQREAIHYRYDSRSWNAHTSAPLDADAELGDPNGRCLVSSISDAITPSSESSLQTARQAGTRPSGQIRRYQKSKRLPQRDPYQIHMERLLSANPHTSARDVVAFSHMSASQPWHPKD